MLSHFKLFLPCQNYLYNNIKNHMILLYLSPLPDSWDRLPDYSFRHSCADFWDRPQGSA